MKWVIGGDSIQDVLATTDAFTLRAVAADVRCPLLILHGESDRQVPVQDARSVYDAAVNARERELKVFTLEDGGAEHCSIDNDILAIDYLADWLAERLVTV